MNILTAAAVLADMLPGLLANVVTPVFRVAEHGALANLLLAPGNIIVIGGMPAVGKSSFIFQVTADFLRLNCDHLALFANVEMSPEELMTREVSRISGVYLGVDRGELSDEEVERIKGCMPTLNSYASRLAILPMPFTLDDIIAAIESFNPTLVVIDYLQCIDTGGGAADNNERLRLNRILGKLREHAAGRVIILVSALKRTSTNYNPKDLGLDSFRETGGIEYGCSSGYILIPNPDAKTDGQVHSVILRHLKSRGTEKVDIHLNFDGRFHRWTGADDVLDAIEPKVNILQGDNQESQDDATKAEILNLLENHQIRKAANDVG